MDDAISFGLHSDDGPITMYRNRSCKNENAADEPPTERWIRKAYHGMQGFAQMTRSSSQAIWGYLLCNEGRELIIDAASVARIGRSGPNGDVQQEKPNLEIKRTIADDLPRWTPPRSEPRADDR